MKIATTYQLRHACCRSTKAGFSRLPDALLWDDIDPEGLHVLQRMPEPRHHGEGANLRPLVRCLAMLKMKGVPDAGEPLQMIVDLTFEDWDSLADAGCYTEAADAVP